MSGLWCCSGDRRRAIFWRKFPRYMSMSAQIRSYLLMRRLTANLRDNVSDQPPERSALGAQRSEGSFKEVVAGIL